MLNLVVVTAKFTPNLAVWTDFKSSSKSILQKIRIP